jgi:hypothetical protein
MVFADGLDGESLALDQDITLDFLGRDLGEGLAGEERRDVVPHGGVALRLEELGDAVADGPGAS